MDENNHNSSGVAPQHLKSLKKTKGFFYEKETYQKKRKRK